MAKIPLIFAAKTVNMPSQNNQSTKFHKQFIAARNETLLRDNYVCQCCDFFDQSNQVIHFLDGNYINFDQSNLATVCLLCHQTFTINDETKRNNTKLIWLPELSQANINNLVRALLIIKYRKSTKFLATELRDTNTIANSLTLTMQAIISLFQNRENKALVKFYTSDPYILAEALQSIPQSKYEMRGKYLDGLRILPSEIFFKEINQATADIVESWYQENGTFRGLSPTTWRNLYQPLFTSNSNSNCMNIHEQLS